MIHEYMENVKYWGTQDCDFFMRYICHKLKMRKNHGLVLDYYHIMLTELA